MRRRRRGITLVEVMVVVAVIAVLLAILIPIVRAARESARRASCVNNLKQIGAAFLAYNAATNVFPPSMVASGSGNIVAWTNGWSAQARILPYLDQKDLFNSVNWTLHRDDPANTTTIGTSIDVLVCPSDPSPRETTHKYGVTAATSYGVSQGDWFVWGGFSGPETYSAFGVNRALRLDEFLDGTSSSLLAAEVKIRQPASDCRTVPLSKLVDRDKAAESPWDDRDPHVIAPEYATGPLVLDEFHTAWADGNVHAAGFTTAWTPNRAVFVDVPGRMGYDLDLSGRGEERGGPTFAAITSRGYHPGGVNALFGDGSVRFIKNTVRPDTWRSLGTVDGSNFINTSY